MNITKKDLQKRIVEISYKKNLSHIGSCLTAVDPLMDIYSRKRPQDVVILSQGHAGLALYVMLEAFNLKTDAEELFDKHGVHPNRDLDNDIFCSNGSLGHGLPIALGMAIANKDKIVHCLISDGECAEGSIWEALMIAKKLDVSNLKVYVNANGYSAYDKTNVDSLIKMTKAIGFPVRFYLTAPPDIIFLRGLKAHYHVMDEDDYKEIMEAIDAAP